MLGAALGRGGIIVAATLTALLLAGCSTLTLNRAGGAGSVDALVAQQRYGLALARLEQLRAAHPKDPKLAKKHKQVLHQAYRFEQRTIRAAREQQKQGDWGGALKVLDTALTRFPESTVLQETRTALKAEQKKRLRELDVNLAIARAGWLLEQRHVLTERKDLAAGHWTDRWTLDRIDAELKRLQPALVEHGLAELKRGNLDSADQALQRAAQIKRNAALDHALSALGKARRERARRSEQSAHRAQAERIRRRQQALLTQARRQLDAHSLIAARRSLAAAHKLDADNPQLGTLETELADVVKARVAKLVADGNTLYRRGKFSEARSLWQQAVTLDPGNTLARARLERADRVIRKLDKLRQEQQPTPGSR